MTALERLSDLRGRRALITGALGGLGRVFACTLAEMGADLVLVDRPEGDFSDLLSELSRWSVEVIPMHCNIESEDDRRRLIGGLNDSDSQLSILINNAAFVGTSSLPGWSVPFEQQNLEAWRRAMEVNLTAVFDFCQGLTPLLRKSPGANIVNIASLYGFLGPDWSLYEGTNMSNPAAYAAAKGGLIQLTRWLSTTLAPDVRVNSISPGGIWRNQPEIFVERYAARTPLGRMASENDFIGSIAFLCSDLSNYITGQNIMVDGGWSAW